MPPVLLQPHTIARCHHPYPPLDVVDTTIQTQRRNKMSQPSSTPSNLESGEPAGPRALPPRVLLPLPPSLSQDVQARLEKSDKQIAEIWARLGALKHDIESESGGSGSGSGSTSSYSSGSTIQTTSASGMARTTAASPVETIEREDEEMPLQETSQSQPQTLSQRDPQDKPVSTSPLGQAVDLTAQHLQSLTID